MVKMIKRVWLGGDGPVGSIVNAAKVEHHIFDGFHADL